MDGNTVTPIISAEAINGITSTLQTNITQIAPALLGLMAVTLVAGVVFKFIRRNKG